jgi:hypothetical protein
VAISGQNDLPRGILRLGIFYSFFGGLSPGRFTALRMMTRTHSGFLPTALRYHGSVRAGGPPHGRQNWVLYLEAGHTAAGRGGLSTGGGGIGLGGSSIGGRRCGS